MSLTIDQKVQLIKLHGLDPSEWSVSPDETQLINEPMVQPQAVITPIPQPVVPTTQVSPTPQISATGAFLKSAIHSAPEAAGSGVGAGTGLAFGLGLAPETGGLSMLIPLATTLAGGYLGGKAVSSVQQAAEAKMPDYQAQLQQAEQQHPVASKFGQLSTIPLGGLNPNPANVLRAGGGLAKMLLSEGGATPEEAANVLNVGAGAVLGGVQSGLSGGSVGDIAQNAAIGALFNDPNAIGKRLGFHPVTQRPILDPDTYAQMLSQKSDSTGEEVVNPTPSSIQPSIPDVSSTYGGLPFAQGSILKKRIPYLESTDTQPSELSTMQAEGGLDKDVIAAQKEDFNPESGQPYTGKELDRNQEPQAGRLLTPAGKALQQHVADLQAKYPGLDVSTIPPEYLKAMSEQVSGLHGIETTSTEGITDQNGQPVKGTAHVGTQKTSINPTLADAGTQPHEDFHHIFGTMPATTKTELLDATKNEFDAFNASRVQAGQPAFTHEEYLATEMGYRTVSRLLNASGETPLKQWWNDFKSGVKVKFGAEPTVEDLYRNNVYKLIHGKSNVAAAGLHPGISQNQEDEISPKFIGHQADFSGKTSGFDLYNLQQPILDKDGKVLHSAGSTVSEGTLTKYGIQVPEKNQPGEEGLTPRQVYKAAQYQKNRETMLAQSKANQAANKDEHDQIIAGAPRTAGIPPHTYPQDDAGYQPPSSAPMRRIPITMNEGETKVASNVIYKGLNRLFYKNLPMTMIKQWKSEFLPELHDAALAELSTKGLDVPKSQDHNAETFHADWNGYFQKNPSSLNETIASSAGRRAIEQFSQFTRKFKEQHGYTVSLDTAGIEGRGIQDKVGHIPTSEITSKARQTGPEATETGGTDVKRVQKIKKEAEQAASNATAGQAKGLLREMHEQAIEDEDEEMAKHYKGLLDTLEKVPDEQKIDLQKFQDAASEPSPAKKTEGIGEDNKNELDKLKFQGGEEGLTKKVASNPDTTPSQKYNFLWIMPELDQARRHAGPAGEPLAKSLQQLPTVRDQMYGKYTSKFLKMADSVNEVDKKKVLQTLYREDSEGQSYRNLLTSPKQRALYDEFRRALVEKQTDQQNAGQMVTDFDQNGKKFQRPAKVNPTYAPSILRADVIEQILERTPKGKQYEAQLLKYWKDQGASDQYAKDRLTALKSMEDSTQKNETRFGANRLTEGMGIPPELRVSSLEKMTSRYFSKVATDRAWHDTVEKNPEAMKALEDEDVKHYYGGIIDKIKGEPFDKDTGTIKAWNRLFTSALLGPLTNIHIGMSTFFNPFQYVKGSELASVYFKGMQHIGESAQHAIENGYKRKDLNTVHDIIDSQNTFLQKAGAVSSLIGKVNGREFTDKVAKTFAQALGEEIVPLRIAGAKDSDAWSIKMMKQLDANWTPDKVYSKQEQSQMASVLGGMIHGSHDYRTLPEIMNRETVVKPFISLMSWSVAQTNQWMKHVWEPATTGNLQPLIMSTLGALVGGYVIQQMRQAVTDKKSNIPSLSEIANSSKGVEGNVPLLAYNFMQMASYTGWIGLGSTIGKYGFDAAYKNIPQGATFPLDEAVTSIGSTMNEAVSAWLQSPTSDDFFRIFPKALLDMGKENWQLARIATNWAADYGETGESEEYKKEVNTGTGDLRRYRMAEGLPYEQQTESANNPYLNLQQKGFKRTSDLGEAAQDIPGLMQLAMQRSKGNPEVFKSQLESLKQNSFQTMPSPETMPSQFSRYYKYLVSTQGPEVAAQRMQEYMMHSAINRVKAGMVP